MTRLRSSAPTKKLTPRIPITSLCGALLQTARLNHVEVYVLSVDVPVLVLVPVMGYVELEVNVVA
jgi:hypothetical protein